jgi:hypothetical protein
MEKYTFRIGDYVIVKAGTLVDDLGKVRDWGGQIEEIYEDSNTYLIQLDAKTLNALSNAYLIVSSEKGEDTAKYVFEFSDLELGKKRDTIKSRAKALKRMNARIDGLNNSVSELSYSKEFEEGDDEIWAAEFVKSKYFNQLNSEQQENANFIVSVFLDYMNRYVGKAVSKWTASDVLEVAAGVMPSKIAEDVSFFRPEADVLIAFFDFLKNSGRIKKVKHIQNAIDKARPEIIAIASDSSRWGFAKQFAMKAIAKNVDLDDKEALNKFMKEEQNEVLGEISQKKSKPSFIAKLFGNKS